MKRLLLAACLITGAALSAACTRQSLAVGEARLSVDGTVEVAGPGLPYKTVGDSKLLHRGDRVRVRSGTAVMRMAGGGTLELRRGTEITADRQPVLRQGDVLVTTGEAPVTVSAAEGKARVTEGAARLSRSLAFLAATYRGGVQVSSFGRTLEVPALRQTSVAAPGALDVAATPLRYSNDDEWDRRFLGLAMELDSQLVSRSEGFTTHVQGQPRTLAFFEAVLPDLERQRCLGDELLRADRASGETLVGAAIVLEGGAGGFCDRWHDVFAFRDAGAAWGLVALDQHATDVVDLTTLIDVAIGRTVVNLAAPAGLPVVAPAGRAGELASPAPPSTTTTTPAPTGPPATAPAPPPGSSGPTAGLPAPPGEVGGTPVPDPAQPLAPVLDPLESLVDAVGGILRR